MKILSAPTLFFLFLSIANCQTESTFEKIPPSEIDRERLEFAAFITREILTAQRNGSFYKLNEEQATPVMVNGLDETKQKQAYQQIQSVFGDYRDVEFHHMSKAIDGTAYEMYRFRGKFNPDADVEVRTVLDATGRLAGFFVIPWRGD